ncbi:MAG: hypothetical protein J7K68_00365 [Candidatus Diapherotrites archaeon]|nr:hypothetical protein [Candidatus Diapherotrites archaeon]
MRDLVMSALSVSIIVLFFMMLFVTLFIIATSWHFTNPEMKTHQGFYQIKVSDFGFYKNRFNIVYINDSPQTITQLKAIYTSDGESVTEALNTTWKPNQPLYQSVIFEMPCENTFSVSVYIEYSDETGKTRVERGIISGQCG